ncbi:MAG TPA: hypothetical protein VMZ91_14685 [Candidatus Paceibacterota bacterium]|nr:hypothetical protein [Candidatus Paceibacterota bacterium]
MVKKNYYHFALNSEREKEIIDLKKLIEEKLKISNPTNDDLWELLVKKNKMFTIPEIEAKKIIIRKRGVQI